MAREYFEAFDSLYSLVDNVEHGDYNEFERATKTRTSITKAEPDSFHGFCNWEETLQLVRNGYPEGLAEIDAEIGELKDYAKLTEPKLYARTAVHGQRPIVPAYLANVPNHMTAFYKEPKETGFLRIVVGIGMYCALDSEVFAKRGAALCEFIDQLESANIRCEIIGVLKCGHARQKGGGKYSDMRIEFNLKNAQDPLDIDSLSFALTHPAMVRRILFRKMEQNEIWKDFSSCYGMHAEHQTSLDSYKQGETMVLNNPYAADRRKTTKDWFMFFRSVYEKGNGHETA